MARVTRRGKGNGRRFARVPNPSLTALGASRNPGHPATRLAFIDDLNIVAVRIKHPGCIIARIVFGTRLRWFLTLSSSR